MTGANGMQHPDPFLLTPPASHPDRTTIGALLQGPGVLHERPEAP